jgi:hypothetical protein
MRAEKSAVARRDFLQTVAAVGSLASTTAAKSADVQPSETTARATPQPTPDFGPELLVTFIAENGGGAGVRLSKPREAEAPAISDEAALPEMPRKVADSYDGSPT